jgi:integrase
MSKRRGHGDGGITPRGADIWRLRYRIGGRRFSTTFHGTLSDARKELRRLIRSGDVGEHIAPDKITLATWVDRWLDLLARQPDGGPRRRGLVNQRSIERYDARLRCHVLPVLGSRPLQGVQPTEIDALYMKLAATLAPQTVHSIHTTLGACLAAAVRKGLLTSNPVAKAEAPSPGESDHGAVLDEEELGRLLEGFKSTSTSMFAIVAVAAFTGARRNEILALRWTDLDISAKTLRIERAVEHTAKYGLALKGPKTARGKRTITISDDLISLLRAEREKHLRIAAGVPDGVAVDLSLVKLPDDALMFPSPPTPGEGFLFNRLRNPTNFTKQFLSKARALGFKELRFHDLRGTHETLLLDAGVPVHTVASRCGHDPAVLLRIYAKRTKKADTSAAAVIGALSKGVLG